ncbi:TPA: hypothetical protein U5E42_002316 [Yersinia enterocolitica]|nr:hypothetical protein [Yersinia enterocolitica]HEN3662551.1 hypothetical protein [Yersinia enterocolitica]
MLQQGSERRHPDELTQVSDSGNWGKLTQLWRRERREYPKPLVLQQGGERRHPDELTQVSDSGN